MVRNSSIISFGALLRIALCTGYLHLYLRVKFDFAVPYFTRIYCSNRIWPLHWRCFIQIFALSTFDGTVVTYYGCNGWRRIRVRLKNNFITATPQCSEGPTFWTCCKSCLLFTVIGTVINRVLVRGVLWLNLTFVPVIEWTKTIPYYYAHAQTEESHACIIYVVLHCHVPCQEYSLT